jgi:integrase
VPSERMKAKRQHRVPLSETAIAILEKQAAIRINDYVFSRTKGNAHVSSDFLFLTCGCEDKSLLQLRSPS